MNRWDLFFTIIFAFELAFNAFCHIFTPFLSNPWNYIDILIVILSIIGVINPNEPTGIVRIIRALRVIRLFGRVRSLKRIISALSMAILPVLNVFLMYFLLLGIGATPCLSSCPCT
jgi:hypothetical protein